MSVKLVSKIVITNHNPPTLQTDGQRRTDTVRQTTCDRKTALCTIVHRAVKNAAVHYMLWVLVDNVLTVIWGAFCCHGDEVVGQQSHVGRNQPISDVQSTSGAAHSSSSMPHNHSHSVCVIS